MKSGSVTYFYGSKSAFIIEIGTATSFSLLVFRSVARDLPYDLVERTEYLISFYLIILFLVVSFGVWIFLLLTLSSGSKFPIFVRLTPYLFLGLDDLRDWDMDDLAYLSIEGLRSVLSVVCQGLRSLIQLELRSFLVYPFSKSPLSWIFFFPPLDAVDPAEFLDPGLSLVFLPPISLISDPWFMN